MKESLTEEERFAVADHAAAQLKERGDPWRLNEEVKPASAPTTYFATGRAIANPRHTICAAIAFIHSKQNARLSIEQLGAPL